VTIANEVGNDVRYDPSATYEVKSRDVEYRREGDTPMLARVYEPQGAGPFPMLFDLHGGGWAQFDRLRDEPVDSELARPIAPTRQRTRCNSPTPTPWKAASLAMPLPEHAPHLFEPGPRRGQ
jgi:acetyl esterase/lipase